MKGLDLVNAANVMNMLSIIISIQIRELTNYKDNDNSLWKTLENLKSPITPIRTGEEEWAKESEEKIFQPNESNIENDL